MSNINFSSRKSMAVKAGLAMAAFIAVVGNAEAKVSYGRCNAGPDRMTASTQYQNYGPFHYRVNRVSWNINNSNPNRPAKNNMYIAIRGYGGFATYWTWTSGDNVREGYGSRSVSVVVPRYSNPYVNYRVTFDRRFRPDPSCTARTNLS